MSETLVIGGTGAMGSRVVERIIEATESTVTVFTRDAQSEQALALLRLGAGRIRLITGDIDDFNSVKRAMASADRVFCNTNFFSTKSAVGEYHQGVRLLQAAHAGGVDKFIWSSLDSAVAITEGRICVPHYDGKAAVASHINLQRSEEMMAQVSDGWYSHHVSILTTSPYFENLQLRLAPKPGLLADGRRGLIFSLPLGTGRYPLIALDDIAWFAVHMLEDWQSWGSRDLAVSGDSLTGAEIAETFERISGVPAGYESIPLEVVRRSIPGVGHDYAAMFQFFQEYDLFDLARNDARIRSLHPGLLSFEDWLNETQWTGEETTVQKYAVRLQAKDQK